MKEKQQHLQQAPVVTSWRSVSAVLWPALTVALALLVALALSRRAGDFATTSATTTNAAASRQASPAQQPLFVAPIAVPFDGIVVPSVAFAPHPCLMIHTPSVLPISRCHWDPRTVNASEFHKSHNVPCIINATHVSAGCVCRVFVSCRLSCRVCVCVVSWSDVGAVSWQLPVLQWNALRRWTIPYLSQTVDQWTGECVVTSYCIQLIFFIDTTLLQERIVTQLANGLTVSLSVCLFMGFYARWCGQLSLFCFVLFFRPLKSTFVILVCPVLSTSKMSHTRLAVCSAHISTPNDHWLCSMLYTDQLITTQYWTRSAAPNCIICCIQIRQCNQHRKHCTTIRAILPM